MKELIQEIMNTPVTEVIISGDVVEYSMEWKYSESINIYKLAYLCKVWADEKGFQIRSFTSEGTGYAALGMDFKTKHFKNSTENDAIFAACEWILENSKGN